MKTVTAEQFKKLYGDAGVSSFDASNTVPQVTSEPKLTDIVGQDISNRVTRVGKILDNPTSSKAEKGLQVFGQGVGLAANTLEQAAIKIPGIKQAAGAIGAGINWLTTSDKSPIKPLGDVIGNSKTLQTVVALYDKDQSFKDTVDAVANIARLGGDVDLAVNSANFTANVTNKVIRNMKPVPKVGGDTPSTATRIPTQDISAGIMNRVARLNPSDMTKFEGLSGKTPGQYLTETGNFGAPDKIIANEAKKFVQSKGMVDAEFAKLPGVYKDGSIADALNALSEKVKSVSTDNVPASYASEVKDLIAKYKSGGLTMEEVNQVKRLFERNVKLGYNKLINADKVEQATNIDNSIRKWQLQKARDLGFKNVDELNKQTQLSRFIVDKLGEKVVGQSALNSIGLTDWIMLSGGTPASISGFLTKKFFSSRAVQAKIAELLNTGETVKGMVKPKVNPTVENTLRKQFPQGTNLELPAGKSPVTENRVPIEVKGASTIEPQAQQVFNESMLTKSSTPVSQPEPKIGKASPQSLPQNAVKSIPKELQSLALEARKYQTPEEFVKAQPTAFHGTSADTKITKWSTKKSMGRIWFTDNKTAITSPENPAAASGRGKIYQVYFDKNAKWATPEMADKSYADQLIAEGYDGVYHPDSSGRYGNYYEVFNPKVIKSKSQLIDIWNRVDKSNE